MSAFILSTSAGYTEVTYNTVEYQIEHKERTAHRALHHPQVLLDVQSRRDVLGEGGGRGRGGQFRKEAVEGGADAGDD